MTANQIQTDRGGQARRTGLYVRISKDRRNEAGIQRQEQECRELASRLGWEVVDVYADNDREASSGRKRPAYERMLDDMRGGRINAVIGWHSDRIVRRPDELEDLMKLAEAHDVMFSAVIVGNIDYSTASGRLVARLLGAAAKYETELKGERQSSQLRQRARAGLVTGGGTRPFGYVDSARSAVHEQEAALVRQLADRALAGETIGALSEWMILSGIPTVRGGQWQPKVVRSILTSPAVAGIATYKGEPVGEAQWPPILDRDTHHRLVELLTYNGPARRNRGARVAFLQGLVWCGRCEYELVTAQVKRNREDPYTRVYSCRTKYLPGRDGYGKSCGALSIKAQWIEDDVAERALARLSRPEARRILAEVAGGPKADRTGHRAELAAAEDRLRQLGVDYADGLLGRTEFLAARDRLQERIDNLHQTIAPAAPRLRLPYGDPAKLVRWWEAASTAQRQAMIRQFVDRIEVAPHRGRRSDYDPSRVGVQWR